MSKSDSYTVILQMLRNCRIEMNTEELTDELSIKDDIGLDSFQIMELLGEMEDRFDLEIPDRQIRNLQTVGQISEFLQRVA